jgi:hypothetical protein
MALIFQVDEEGHPRPKISCDTCGGMIANDAGATACWDSQSTKPGTLVEPTFQCGGCNANSGGAPANSLPMNDFMLYLLNNIQLSPNVLEQAGRQLRSTTHPPMP